MLALQVGFPFVSLQELGFEIHLFVPVKKLHLTMEELPEHLAAELSVLAEDAAVLVAGWLESHEGTPSFQALFVPEREIGSIAGYQ